MPPLEQLISARQPVDDTVALSVAEDTPTSSLHRVSPDRVARTLRRLDVGNGRGMEIGPLYSPMVTRIEGDVSYVDVDTTEALRRHYAAHPGVPVDDIVEVDFPLMQSGRMRTIVEATRGSGPPFSWAVASHVLEHVPDLVGWLADVGGALADNALLALALPDRRYSFDVRRPATTVGQMLAAHDSQDSMPSLRAVFDHHREAVHIAPPSAWRGFVPGAEGRVHDLDYVLSQVALQRSGAQYIDCHVWVFTPHELVLQLEDLARLGLCDFVVDDLLSTAVDELEFFLTLRRIPRGLSEDERSGMLAVGFPTPKDNILSDPAPEPVVIEEPELPPGASREVVSSAERRAIAIKRTVLRRCAALLSRR